MTDGSEIRLILGFMSSLLIGNIFQQLYTMVDTMVVGRFLGAEALGSVGSVGSIHFLFLALCIGLSGGSNVLTAQYFGAEDEQGVRNAIGNSLYVALFSGIVMSLLSVLFAPLILQAMRIPAENYPDALVYMRIVCGGMVITSAYNMVAQILRALGDAKTPLYYAVAASVINVILDLAFTLFFSWGVAGVAWATVIAQLFATVGLWVSARKRNRFFCLQREHWILRMKMVRKICWMGIPLAAQNALGSFSGVIVQSVVNSFGSTVMASFAAAGRVEQLMAAPYGSLGTAVANFTGQNVGAGKFDRVRNGCRHCVFLVLGFSAVMFGVMMLFGRGIVGLFVSDMAVIEMGTVAVRITAAAYFFSGLVYIYKAMLNGAGDTAFSLGNGLIEITARVVFLFLLTGIPALGYWGIWCTAIPSSMLAAFLCIRRYRQGKWKKRRIL